MTSPPPRPPQPALHDLDCWPLATERLTLRPPLLKDADAVLGYRALPEVNRWLGRAITTRQEAVRCVADPERSASMVMVEHRGAVIGDLMLLVGDGWAQVEVKESGAGTQAEIGWAFHPAYGGRGLATEAVTALLGVAFGDLRLRRVTAECFAANEPSWRLMERLGMRRELHAVADSLHRELGWLDNLGYALLREEWLSRGSA